MLSVHSGNLWNKLKQLAKDSNKMNAAVAYVTDDSFIAFGDGDILVVDASDESIASGRTSAKLLKDALARGAKLFSCDTLHGKVIVFDKCAYVGSANISKNSINNLDEVGVISDYPDFCSGAIKLVKELSTESIEIDDCFIERISKIEVKRANRPNKTKRDIGNEDSQRWLITLTNNSNYPGDIDMVEKDNDSVFSEEDNGDWFWLRKRDKLFDLAKVGDVVVRIFKKAKDSQKPKYVCKHVVIKKITYDKEARVKAYHHVSNDEDNLTWGKFLKLAERTKVNNLRKGIQVERTLSEKQSNALFELWDD